MQGDGKTKCVWKVRKTSRQRERFKYVNFALLTYFIARFKYQDCIVNANNNIERAVFCVRDYVKGVQDDNLKIVDAFKKEHT